MRIELLLFLSFLAILVVLIACSVPRRPTPALPPTLFPQLTLTLYDPQSVARADGEAAIAATILPAKPHLPEIDISPPRCYRTISPQLTCLGYLRNTGDADLADIRLSALYSAGAGMESAQASFSLAQPQLPAGRRAPYRLQMPDSRAEQAALEISLASARPAAQSSLELIREDEIGLYQPGTNTYRYQAILRNGSGAVVSDIRLVVTLENAAGAVVGFRAADWPVELPGGAALPVELDLTPLEASAEMRHFAIALARAAAQPSEPQLRSEAR